MNEPLEEVWIRGYRSVRDVRLEVGEVTVLLGANGVGKTNMYRALEVLALSTRQDFLRTAAAEGGVDSMRWAGPKKYPGPVRLEFGASWTDLSVELVLGFPSPTGEHINAFTADPEIKEECIWPAHATPRSWLYRRQGRVVSCRADPDPIDLPNWVEPWEVGLAEIGDPALFPEVELIRRRLGSWRFYHQFRSDADSPLRRPMMGFRSPVLDSDGGNLAPATILQIGDAARLQQVVAEVFEGGQLQVNYDRPEFEFSVTAPHLMRPLAATELSDGQLRFLCLAAALLSPRPPELFVLNEPEASLHEKTLGTLAALIASASIESQLIVTTHSLRLVEELRERCAVRVLKLDRCEGATTVEAE